MLHKRFSLQKETQPRGKWPRGKLPLAEGPASPPVQRACIQLQTEKRTTNSSRREGEDRKQPIYGGKNSNCSFYTWERCPPFLLSQAGTVIRCFPRPVSKTELPGVNSSRSKGEFLHTVAEDTNCSNYLKGQLWLYLSNKNANSTYRTSSKRCARMCAWNSCIFQDVECL